MKLTPLYVTRLGLQSLDLSVPTYENLCRVQEAHLANIPFENTSQHGVGPQLPCLDVEATVTKLMEHKRGGFCFELNGLLSYWLEEIGYKVTRVPGTVLFEDGTPKSEEASHLILVVQCIEVTEEGTSKKSLFFVDVGFGEPSLHPLRYDDEFFAKMQVTPEGMKSQIVRDGDFVYLYWEKEGRMIPRLRWNYSASHLSPSPSLSDFQAGLQSVLHPESIFSKKLVVTKLTRDRKYTLAGSRFKVTGPPRFAEFGEPTIDIRHLSSEEEAHEILQEVFGIPKASSAGLTLVKSNTAPTEMWTDL
jgi:N-hydroxyarylamine O-acetyltransferase